MASDDKTDTFTAMLLSGRLKNREDRIATLESENVTLRAERDEAVKRAEQVEHESTLAYMSENSIRLSLGIAEARATAAESTVSSLRAELDRLNRCLTVANERTDENFTVAVRNAHDLAISKARVEALVKALEAFAPSPSSRDYIANSWTPDNGYCAATSYTAGHYRRRAAALENHRSAK